MATESTEKRRRRVYLVRHGEVSYFDAQGKPLRPDGVPLNDQGRVQAAALAEVLAGVPLDRVVASNLARSIQTAEIIVAGRGLLLETRQELREIQPGRLADIPEDQLEDSFLGAFKKGIARDTRFLAGETFGALEDRVLGFLETLLAAGDWQHGLLVAHGGVNRVLLGHALGTGLQAFGAMEQDAGCLNLIDVNGDGRMLVRLMNHTPWNDAKIGMQLTTMERIFQEYRR